MIEFALKISGRTGLHSTLDRYGTKYRYTHSEAAKANNLCTRALPFSSTKKGANYLEQELPGLQEAPATSSLALTGRCLISAQAQSVPALEQAPPNLLSTHSAPFQAHPLPRCPLLPRPPPTLSLPSIEATRLSASFLLPSLLPRLHQRTGNPGSTQRHPPPPSFFLRDIDGPVSVGFFQILHLACGERAATSQIHRLFPDSSKPASNHDCRTPQKAGHRR